MVPIHESDVAENRWKKAEWSHIEFWEKIEVKLRRKKTLIVLLVVALFLFLISIPVLMDRMPKWRAFKATRKLTVLVNQVKLQSAQDGVPYRIEFTNQESGPVARVFKTTDCNAPIQQASWIYDFPVFLSPKHSVRYRFLMPADASSLNLERIEQSFCYDPAQGYTKGDETRAIGLIFVKDLTNQRVDRISFLNILGKSAEISFD